MNQNDFLIITANATHVDFAQIICEEYESSAKARGTGIAKRSPDYVKQKMLEGKSIIAFEKATGVWAGFCYIETWSHGEYVANSGLIVSPIFRKAGLAKAIKQEIFKLSRRLYPDAKIFGLTTGLAVMKINSDLGYEPVTYSELTQDDAFWAGCKSCVNYDILMSKDRKNCMCTAMLYDPKDHYKPEETAEAFKEKKGIYERWLRIKKRWRDLFDLDKQENNGGGGGSLSSVKRMLSVRSFW
jgi:hypothetical protein